MPGWSSKKRGSELGCINTIELCKLCKKSKVSVEWQRYTVIYEDSETGVTEYEKKDPIIIKKGHYWPDNPYSLQFIICDNCFKILTKSERNKHFAWVLVHLPDRDLEEKQAILSNPHKYIKQIEAEVNKKLEKIGKMQKIFN